MDAVNACHEEGRAASLGLRRSVRSGLAAAGLACGLMHVVGGGAAAAPTAEPIGLQITERGSITLPASVADENGAAVSIAGLSGLAWLGRDRYAAVIDDTPLILLLRLRLAADGRPLEVRIVRSIHLRAFRDREDLAWHPRLETRVLVCDEDGPAVRLVDLAGGEELGDLPLPEVLRGRRVNRGLEAVAIEPDGTAAWTCTEEAVESDGPAASVGVGSIVRLVRLPLSAGTAAADQRQASYVIDPPHAAVRLLDGQIFCGVSAIAAWDRDRLLILERSASPSLPPFRNRIYGVALRGAEDVSGHEGPLGSKGAVPKTLLWTGRPLSNLESLCLGPALEHGGRSLLVATETGGLGQPPELIAFTVNESPPEKRATSP
jgi:hypothetical protein